jgi:hypothetical protein
LQFNGREGDSVATWYSRDVGDGDIGFKPVRRIFETFFKATNLRSDMALFSVYDVERNVVRVYLSPACYSVAHAIGAKPCDKPDPEGLSLLYGHSGAWSAFFPS